ncbi:unknown [Feldmannia species virus]|uniref:Uncharacterized protein n=1 Tax=Feldmannia species virus TaxID=39420 RepID=B5LWN9_9PHYC|nr:hypothetical protein FeldSpV_gp150 [Feldmannia species virus]ACH46902.1 unknown [Feldmannia species virus]
MMKKGNYYVDLEERRLWDKLALVTKVNPLIWAVVRSIPAAMTVGDLTFLGEEDRLFVQQEGSQLSMMGMSRYAGEEFAFGDDVMVDMGILGKKKMVAVDGNAHAMVSTVSTCLQASYRLGRFTTLQSAFFPVVPKEFLLLKSVDWGKKVNPFDEMPTISLWRNACTGELSFAARVVAGLDGGKSIPSLPLMVIGQMTRPDDLGELRASSKDMFFNKMGRFPDLLKSSLSGGDGEFIAYVYKHFHPVQIESRRRATVERNRQNSVGVNRKVKRGRMLEDVEETARLVTDMAERLVVNGVTPVMRFVTESEIDMCWEILRKERWNAGERVNEDHIYTAQVRHVAASLGARGLTCEAVSVMTGALLLIVAFTSPPLRRQCNKRIMPRNTYVELTPGGEFLVDILPDDCKDDVALLNSEEGMEMLHRKHEFIERSYAVMIVLGRAFLRLKNGGEIDECVGPLDEHGKVISDDRRNHLFKRAGKNFFGIPRLGEHVCRSIGVTLMLEKAVKMDLSFDSHIVEAMVRGMRTSKAVARRNYNSSKNSRFVSGMTPYDMGVDTRPRPAKRERDEVNFMARPVPVPYVNYTAMPYVNYQAMPVPVPYVANYAAMPYANYMTGPPRFLYF